MEGFMWHFFGVRGQREFEASEKRAGIRLALMDDEE